MRRAQVRRMWAQLGRLQSRQEVDTFGDKAYERGRDCVVISHLFGAAGLKCSCGKGRRSDCALVDPSGFGWWRFRSPRVHIMSVKRDKELRDLLAEAGLASDERLGTEWWVHQRDQNHVPVVEVALFLREAWKRIIPDEQGAVDSLLMQFEERMHDDDSYQAARLKSNPQFLADIRAALKTPGLGPALLYLVRAAQIDTAFGLVSLMDAVNPLMMITGHPGAWLLWTAPMILVKHLVTLRRFSGTSILQNLPRNHSAVRLPARLVGYSGHDGKCYKPHIGRAQARRM